MARSTSYKIVLWRRWCREVGAVENEGQHFPQAYCQTVCIRRGNVNNIFLRGLVFF